MKSIKPGRGPSMMGGVVGIFMIGFGILWTVIAAQASGIFAIFGVLWTCVAKDGHHRHSEKPPGRRSQYFLYRNAKFAPVKTRGEFGVSHHAFFLSARRRNSGVGCRDPPDQSF